LQKTSKINLIDLAGSERAKKVLDEGVIKDANTMDTRLKVINIIIARFYPDHRYM